MIQNKKEWEIRLFTFLFAVSLFLYQSKDGFKRSAEFGPGSLIAYLFDWKFLTTFVVFIIVSLIIIHFSKIVAEKPREIIKGVPLLVIAGLALLNTQTCSGTFCGMGGAVFLFLFVIALVIFGLGIALHKFSEKIINWLILIEFIYLVAWFTLNIRAAYAV